jgi:hypothetical protein
VDYKSFIKPLALPVGYVAPTELRDQDMVARVLGRSDIVADVAGINSSLDIIRQTRGGSWPTGPISEEFDYIDLVWHECEFRENYSFSYAVYETTGQYLGCCYFYPMGRRTPLDASLVQHDVDVSWWVTTDAYRRGFYPKLYAAIRRWVLDDFPFTHPHFSNRQIPGQNVL